MRARYPDADGLRRARRRPDRSTRSTAPATRPVLLVPTWSIVHSRIWKAQIPYLARRHRVDHVRRPRQRPLGPAGRPRRVHATRDCAATSVAVMDATGIGARRARRRCRAAPDRSLLVAAEHPERVARPRVHRTGVAASARPDRSWHATSSRTASRTTRAGTSTTPLLASRLPRPSSSSSSAQCFSEPHSTKQIEDAVDWGLETDAGVARRPRRGSRRRLDVETRAAIVSPDPTARSLVIHGRRRPDHRRRPGRAPRRRRSGSAPGAARRGRPHPQRPRPGPRQPAAPRLHRPAMRSRVTRRDDRARCGPVVSRRYRASSRARRCPRRLRGIRARRADDPARPDVAHRPFASLEGADPIPRPRRPGGHLRSARQRHVRPTERQRGLLGARDRGGHPRRHGRDRPRTGRCSSRSRRLGSAA